MEPQIVKRIPIFKKSSTLFQYNLTSKQNIYTNYILPSILSLVIYILHFSADIVLSYQHYKTENPFYASLTLWWIFVPVISSFFMTVINLDLWPAEENCGSKSFKWFFIRFFQHLLFPIWAMYRYAEQIFWRIEALRTKNEIDRAKLLMKSERRSIFSLYHFLQAYFQCVPQMLFQINIILKHPADFDKDTVDLQILSIFLSLVRISMTTTSYQRFGTQKLAGRQYPWDKIKQKEYKVRLLQQTYSKTQKPEAKTCPTLQKNLEEMDRGDSTKHQNAATKIGESEILETIRNIGRRDSGLSITSSQFEAEIQKQKEEIMKKNPEPIKIDSVFGLTGDDSAGKLVANLWWFCFILPRMFTLAVFTYFYLRESILICFLQYTITLSVLLRHTSWYDPEENETATRKRKKYPINNENVQKFSFHLITSFIFLFCLIEFKTRFTRVKKVYNFYFIFLYLENICMMLTWYYHAETYDKWWFNYLLYLIIISSILSVLSMAMYLSLLRPRKKVVNKVFRSSKL